MDPSHAQTATLTHFMNGYLEVRSAHLRTAYATGRCLRRMVAALPDVSLSELRRVDIAAYVQQRTRQGVSDGTVNRELLLLSAAINYAKRRWGWQVDNPVPGQYLRWPPGRLRYLTKPEANRLHQAAGSTERRGHEVLPDFINFALNTGMRKMEMLGLTWDRVHLDENQIVLESRHTKTAKRRIIPLNKKATVVLSARMQERTRKSDWVFADRRGKQVRNIYPAWWQALELAQIDDFMIHDLRHTFASWLVIAGVSLMEVRDLLGHSSVKMTERYAHLSQDALARAVSVLDDL